MTAALLESAPAPFGGGTRRGTAGGRGITLEERLEAAWRAVRAEGHAECPVCSARLCLEHGAARCAGCGSQLS